MRYHGTGDMHQSTAVTNLLQPQIPAELELHAPWFSCQILSVNLPLKQPCFVHRLACPAFCRLLRHWMEMLSSLAQTR